MLGADSNINLKINFLFSKLSSILEKIENLLIFETRLFEESDILSRAIRLSIIAIFVVIVTIRAIISFLSRLFIISLNVVTHILFLLFSIIFIRVSRNKVVENRTSSIIAITRATILVSIEIENIEIKKFTISSSQKAFLFL